MNSITKIVIFGASGFVGRNLCNYYSRRQNIHVIGVCRNEISNEKFDIRVLKDFESSDALQEIVEGADIVIHAAGLAHLKNDTGTISFNANYLTTAAVADACIQQNVKKFIYISSASVHGIGGLAKITENSPIAPHNAYAWSKFIGELLTKERCLGTNTGYIILRPPMIYGPGAPGNFSLVLKMIRSKLPLPIGAITHNRRSYLGIKNLFRFIEAFIHSPDIKDQTYIISDPEEYSTNKFILSIARLYGYSPFSIYIPNIILNSIITILFGRSFRNKILSDFRLDSSYACSSTGVCLLSEISDHFCCSEVMKSAK